MAIALKSLIAIEAATNLALLPILNLKKSSKSPLESINVQNLYIFFTI